MRTKSGEREAVVEFLEHAAEYQQSRVRARNRLFQLTEEQPEKVIVFLQALPERVVEQYALFRDLRSAANQALRKRAESVFTKQRSGRERR